MLKVNPDNCSHPQSKEKRIENNLICSLCGDVLVTNLPPTRSASDIESDKQQTLWEKYKRI